MKLNELITGLKPYITNKYNRKIRLLLTNQCFRNCIFCHNEGMDKRKSLINIDIEKLSSFFPEFLKITNRIVLSGGEPLLHPRFKELVRILNENGFDILVDTSIYVLDDFFDILGEISDIHISLLEYDNIIPFFENIEQLRHKFPTLKIAINIPLFNINMLKKSFEFIMNMCKINALSIQLIRIFNFCSNEETRDWFVRWENILNIVKPYQIKITDTTDREVSCITESGVKIDLIDIPCIKSGIEFGDNVCLNESDITIDPNFDLSFCRWISNKVKLQKPNDFLESVANAYRFSIEGCPYQKLHNKYENEHIPTAAYLKHYIWPPQDNGYMKKIKQQINAGLTSYLGKEGYVRSFENHFAEYLGTQYALSLCSGTVAFYIACQVMEYKRGKCVVISDYSYPGLLSTLVYLGIQVILCDTESDTGNIDYDCLQDILETKNVDGVIVTHLWGKPARIEEISHLCKKYNVGLIEDCSHAIGAIVNGKKVGSFGDVAFFSLQSNKTIYAGEGGIFTTNKKKLYEKAVMYSTLKKRILDSIHNPKYRLFDESGFGLKLKMHPIGAIMAEEALRKLSEVNILRDEHLNTIKKQIKDNNILKILTDLFTSENKRVYYTFKLIMENDYIKYRDIVVNNLIRENLEVTSSSFRPLHQLPITLQSDLIINRHENFIGAELYSLRVISIPSFTYEDKKLSMYYGKMINKQIIKIEEKEL